MKLGGLPICVMALGLAQPASGAALQQTSAEDSLSRCIVMHTSGADRLLTAQWIFAAMAKSPHIADLSAVSAPRKAQIDKAFSQLLIRLVVKDCVEPMRPLAEQNLEAAFDLAGRALGEVAMRELMGNEEVDRAIGEYTAYLAEEDFRPLTDPSFEK